ncbi:MAG: hypothetical protein KBD63_01505 [Bacteriovoracaceae bacterium]|nr:hypothetical protein [Bacteriovoracaceae bacterium]
MKISLLFLMIFLITACDPQRSRSGKGAAKSSQEGIQNGDNDDTPAPVGEEGWEHCDSSKYNNRATAIGRVEAMCQNSLFKNTFRFKMTVAHAENDRICFIASYRNAQGKSSYLIPKSELASGTYCYSVTAGQTLTIAFNIDPVFSGRLPNEVFVMTSYASTFYRSCMDALPLYFSGGINLCSYTSPMTGLRIVNNSTYNSVQNSCARSCASIPYTYSCSQYPYNNLPTCCSQMGSVIQNFICTDFDQNFTTHFFRADFSYN